VLALPVSAIRVVITANDVIEGADPRQVVVGDRRASDDLLYLRVGTARARRAKHPVADGPGRARRGPCDADRAAVRLNGRGGIRRCGEGGSGELVRWIRRRGGEGGGA